MAERGYGRSLVKYVFRYYVRSHSSNVTMPQLNAQTRAFMAMLDAESQKRVTRKERNHGRNDG